MRFTPMHMVFRNMSFVCAVIPDADIVDSSARFHNLFRHYSNG